VTNCPCCGAILAVSEKGLGPGRHTLHFHHDGGGLGPIAVAAIAIPGAAAVINTAICAATPSMDFANGRTTSISISIAQGGALTDANIDDWWYQVVTPQIGAGIELLSARPCRPGYFITTSDNSGQRTREADFEIFCPNPSCELSNTA